jgi:stress response protein YsnF
MGRRRTRPGVKGATVNLELEQDSDTGLWRVNFYDTLTHKLKRRSRYCGTKERALEHALEWLKANMPERHAGEVTVARALFTCKHNQQHDAQREGL